MEPTAPLVEQIQAPAVVVEAVQNFEADSSLEERGDAMLFEADALSSMPFAEAIVMPFD
ncbi:MAG: hypothetical protein V5783_01030 [Pontiella sp.]